jgi:NADPH:quinone reductase-like Zn-dependent oxidoreductase
MRAVRHAEYGGPDVLSVDEVEMPHAGPGQVRIAVRAAGVNAMDWKIRAGHLRQMLELALPAGTGIDAAGTVDQLGDGVEGVSLGDAVFGSGSAAYAEHAVLDAWAVIPDGLSFAEAAGFPVPVETAQRILDQVGVQTGQTLLVSGATGGVGTAVVQIAVYRGVRVIGTASAANQSRLTALGATATTYGPGLVQRVREVAPQGVDAALDLAGSGIIAELVELTGNPAAVVSIADFSAPEHGAQVSAAAGDRFAAYAEAARLWQAGVLSIPVQQSFPLQAAAAAQRLSEDGHVTGRLVITVTDPIRPTA